MAGHSTGLATANDTGGSDQGGEAAVLFPPDACANCDTALAIDVRGLFCATGCRETAKAIRYARAALRDGRLDDPEVMRAVDAKFVWARMGGCDTRERRVPLQVLAKVRIRDQGRCVKCGASGEEVDHIAGSSPEPENLQLLCRRCHHAKTMVVRAPEADYVLRAARLPLWNERVLPDGPVRLRDSAEWVRVWSGLAAERRRRLHG